MDKVIIDGVDVSGCEFAVKVINDNRIKCHCAKGLLQIAKMQEQPESIKSGLCENNPNCYYKQLQRVKTKKEKLIDQNFKIAQKYTKLEQENERLKKQYNCYACDSCGGKEDYINMKRHTENAIKTVHKYSQAMQEIQEDLETQSYCECSECGNDEYDKCIECMTKRYLAKINEVIGVK